MADVRLTAINPEDSSAVPVACNEKGELKLEAPPEFDGTVDGDLVVTGKGTFGSTQSIIGNDGSAQFAAGQIDFYANGRADFAGGAISLGSNGSSTFSGGSIALSLSGNVSAAGDLVAKRGLFNVPANVWADRSFFNVEGLGQLYSSGSFGVSLAANGYRAKSAEWVSYEANGLSGAAEVSLRAEGQIRLATQAEKPTGSDFSMPNTVVINPDQTVGVGRVNAATLFEVNGEVSLVSRGTRYTIVEQSGLAHLVPIESEFDVESEDVVATTVERPSLRDIPAELTMVEQQLQKVMEMLRLTPEAGWEVWDGSD